jgi:hypothetical protein
VGPSSNLRRSFAGVGRTAFLKDVIEDMSQKNARRIRAVVWLSVFVMVGIGGGGLWVMQQRVAESEQRMATERASLVARGDSIRRVAEAEAATLRSSFDSALSSSAPRAVLDSLRTALADASTRTGALEQSLVRARQSLDQQLASGDSARRKADEEMQRLRTGHRQATVRGRRWIRCVARCEARKSAPTRSRPRSAPFAARTWPRSHS